LKRKRIEKKKDFEEKRKNRDEEKSFVPPRKDF